MTLTRSDGPRSTSPHPARRLPLAAVALGATTFAIALVLVAGASARAADLAAGRTAAGQCTVCHGKDGLATAPEAPNLAGESALYIEKQLKAFRSGERQHQQMSIIAQGLDDATIKDLAAWYDAMIVTVELPPTE